MMISRRTIACLLALPFLLSGCGSEGTVLPSQMGTGSDVGSGSTVLEDPAPAATIDPEDVSAAKAGMIISLLLNGPSARVAGPRPTGTLGVYVGLYLAQGAFVPVQTAMQGIEVMEQILLGQSTPESSETFALLKEFGSILQIDVVDVMNRSRNRAEALETYLRSLRNIMELANRKIAELNALEETLDERQKEQRTTVRDMERVVQTALREEDFELAGSKQEELVKAKAALAATEAEFEQTGDILDPYERLMEIADERANAIEKNRAILIAGLQVVDVPGIEDLELIEEGASWRDRILPSNAIPLSR